MKLVEISSTSSVETFTITAGALRVTDPCYSMDAWCAGTLNNALNGTWEAHVGYHKDSLDMSSSVEYRARLAEKAEKEPLYYGEELRRYDEASAAYLGRIAYIHIVAQGYERHFDHSTELDSTWELADIDVGVDSGQAGFFDVVKYANAVLDKEDDSASRSERGEGFQSFYDTVCDLTLADKSFGVVEFGCVSSSGYGDGGYNCYVRRNDVGQAIEAIITFIEDYHEEDEELAA